MTKSEIITALENLDGFDIERAHIDADALLLTFIDSLDHKDVVDAYVKIRDEIGFYYH